jgi:hypothetical protein
MRIALVVSSRISQAASLTALLCTTVAMLCSVLSRAVLGGRIGLSRKRAMQLCEDKESPLDVMFDNMLFWHRQSKDLGGKLNAICGKIKNDDDRREAMSLARMFLSARENAQRCAVDGAPYVHAKLQAVHHEHGPLLEPLPDWQQDDGGADGTADRRRRRFHDFKRRRQERQLFAVPLVRAPKRDDASLWLGGRCREPRCSRCGVPFLDAPSQGCTQSTKVCWPSQLESAIKGISNTNGQPIPPLPVLRSPKRVPPRLGLSPFCARLLI